MDCQWIFGEHVKEQRSKITRRLSVICRGRNTVWGLECRILPIAVRTPIQGIINYGPSAYSSHCTRQTLEHVDKAASGKAARKVSGAGFSVRREVLRILPDAKAVTNRYFLKADNLVLRALRADETHAQRNIQRAANGGGGVLGGTQEIQRCFYWGAVNTHVEGIAGDERILRAHKQ